MSKIKMGHMYKVANTEKHHAANTEYFAINVEDESGDNERWILLTLHDFVSMPWFGGGGWVESFKPGRLYPVSKGASDGYYMRYINFSGNPDQCYIPAYILKRAELRAVRNPEDLPKKSLVTDMLD